MQPTLDDNALPRALVARQPICERNQQTFGYELLFRQPGARRAVIDNPEQATAQVIVSSFFEIGMERMVGSSMAFINITRDFILENYCRFLPKDRVVFEISEDTLPDSELLDRLAALRADGFRFALDDFAYQDHLLTLLPYCSFVKVDLRQADRKHMEREIASLREFPVMLLAEKVQSVEEFEFCQRMGFEYFQGYFLCKPKLVSTPKLPLSRVTVCKVLAKLQEPDVTPHEVGAVVGEDIALSYRLLRYINSTALALPLKIESISHAVRLVGIDTIRMFTNLVMLSSLDEKPQELMRTSLVRARMCQLLASSNACPDEDSCFTVGLFSKLDAFLDCGMEAALQLLALTDEVYGAILHRHGALGRILNMVIAYEQSDWESLTRMDADALALKDAHSSAVEWEESLISEAGESESPLVV